MCFIDCLIVWGNFKSYLDVDTDLDTQEHGPLPPLKLPTCRGQGPKFQHPASEALSVT